MNKSVRDSQQEGSSEFFLVFSFYLKKSLPKPDTELETAEFAATWLTSDDKDSSNTEMTQPVGTGRCSPYDMSNSFL